MNGFYTFVLFQAGPLEDVRIPVANGVKRAFGFVVFKHEISVPYALYLLDGTKLFGRAIKLNSRSNGLHLYQPPVQKRVDRPRLDDDAALRQVGGRHGKRFNDKSMQPSRPSRNAKKMRETSTPSLLWGGFSERSSYNSMLPSHGRNHFRRDHSPETSYVPHSKVTFGKRHVDSSMLPSRRRSRDSPPNKHLDISWSPHDYPSQRSSVERHNRRMKSRQY